MRGIPAGRNPLVVPHRDYTIIIAKINVKSKSVDNWKFPQTKLNS
jgi:hypothetical protein